MCYIIGMIDKFQEILNLFTKNIEIVIFLVLIVVLVTKFYIYKKTNFNLLKEIWDTSRNTSKSQYYYKPSKILILINDHWPRFILGVLLLFAIVFLSMKAELSFVLLTTIIIAIACLALWMLLYRKKKANTSSYRGNVNLENRPLFIFKHNEFDMLDAALFSKDHPNYFEYSSYPYPDVIIIKQESGTSLENKFITFQIELFYQDDKKLLKFQLDFSSKQLLELLPCLTKKESVSLHLFSRTVDDYVSSSLPTYFRRCSYPENSANIVSNLI